MLHLAHLTKTLSCTSYGKHLWFGCYTVSYAESHVHDFAALPILNNVYSYKHTSLVGE